MSEPLPFHVDSIRFFLDVDKPKSGREIVKFDWGPLKQDDPFLLAVIEKWREQKQQ